MTVLHLGAPAAIAASLPVPTAGVRVVQQRTGTSGWLDRIWTHSFGLDPVIPPRAAQTLRPGGDRYRLPFRTRQFVPLSSQKGVVT